MLTISEIKPGTAITLKNEPYEVLKAEHHKMGRGRGILNVTLRNLVTGNTLLETFKGNEKLPEADLGKKTAQYLYSDEENGYFMDQESFEQFSILNTQLGDKKKFLIDGEMVEILMYNDKPINIAIPIKVRYRIKIAPPAVRGDSANSVTKTVTCENGLEVNVPLFIEEGDWIIVDTRSGQYVERANN